MVSRLNFLFIIINLKVNYTNLVINSKPHKSLNNYETKNDYEDSNFVFQRTQIKIIVV